VKKDLCPTKDSQNGGERRHTGGAKGGPLDYQEQGREGPITGGAKKKKKKQNLLGKGKKRGSAMEIAAQKGMGSPVRPVWGEWCPDGTGRGGGRG